VRTNFAKGEIIKTKLFPLALLGLAVATANAQTFSNSNSITINDFGAATPYPSSITVSGLSGDIGTLTVSLSGFGHTFPEDVDVLLVGPAGQNVVLMGANGGGNAVQGVDLTFMDGAPFLPDNIVSGTYSPSDSHPFTITFPDPAPSSPYGSALSVFNGTDGNGTWNLFVADHGPGDSGVISGGWSLTFTAVPEPTTTALMLVAVGALGVAALRKRKTAARSQ
jgi:subtilisin-like proprotein convertase family protein